MHAGLGLEHRRRINTEEKATVVAAVWGTEFIQFLALLAIFHGTILKNRKNSSFTSNHPGAIHPVLQSSYSAKQLRSKEFNKFSPQTVGPTVLQLNWTSS